MGKRYKSIANTSTEQSDTATTFTAPLSTFDAALASLFATSVREQSACSIF
jgi:hypothetical protein